MSWEEFLRFISGPGVAVAVGLILSWVAEYVPGYSYLDPKHKRLVYAALCLVVPLAGAALLALSGFERWCFDPLLWRALAAGAASFGAGTLAHTPKLPSATERNAYNAWLTRYIAER